MIAEVRIHGNHVTSDADVLAISGVTIGAPFGPTTISDALARLRASKKFDDVQVLKRFASIADPLQIVVVIIVNEGPVRIDVPANPSDPLRIVKRQGIHNLMFMPILDAEDGYGVTFGARLALAGAGNSRTRVSFPLTWGGLKQAGAEYERTLPSGPISRVQFGAGIQRQTNPAFQIDDDRRRVWARAERALGPVRAGGTFGWQSVSFDDLDDHITSAGADVTVDTRLDPWLARNAVFASASWEHLHLDSAGGVNRTSLEAQGFIGLFGQSILVLRAARDDASQPLPPYLQSLLGGWSSLRGFKAGSFVGDTRVIGSAELRIPLTSPLEIGKLGVSVFVDEGKAYLKGERYADQPFHRGIGGSVWLSAAVFRVSLSVAHGRGATTRVNFGAGLSF